MSKVCAKCGIEKENQEFRVDNKSKDKLGCWCKECDKEYKRTYYAKNREKVNAVRRERYNNDPTYKAKAKVANAKSYKKNKAARNAHEKEYRNDLQEFVEGLKTSCRKCGEDRPWLIQFHHIIPDNKNFQIQATHSKAKLDEEAKKCICLCSNCHIEYHFFYGKKPEEPVETLKMYLGEEIFNEQTRIN